MFPFPDPEPFPFASSSASIGGFDAQLIGVCSKSRIDDSSDVFLLSFKLDQFLYVQDQIVFQFWREQAFKTSPLEVFCESQLSASFTFSFVIVAHA